MIRKSRMVLAAPGPLLTPPPVPLPPPRRPLTGPTPPKLDPRMKRRTTLPKPYLPPQRRTRHRLSHRLHRQCRCGVIPLPQRALHPTDHVQQETHPTDNPPQSARKNGAGEARRRGGRRRGRTPSAGNRTVVHLQCQIRRSSRVKFLAHQSRVERSPKGRIVSFLLSHAKISSQSTFATFPRALPTCYCHFAPCPESTCPTPPEPKNCIIGKSATSSHHSAISRCRSWGRSIPYTLETPRHTTRKCVMNQQSIRESLQIALHLRTKLYRGC
jgi:hypothetical protein